MVFGLCTRFIPQSVGRVDELCHRYNTISQERCITMYIDCALRNAERSKDDESTPKMAINGHQYIC